MLIPTPYKIVAAIAAFVTFTGGVAWLSYDWGWGVRDASATREELAQTKESLQAFENASLAMNGLAGQYMAISQDLGKQVTDLSGKFRNATRANPLPDTCVPGPDRVRFLSQAIEAANSAIGRGAGPAVPAVTSPSR